MFNKEKNTPAAERLQSKSATLINTGSTLEGDLKSENDLRIDGTIKGNVSCSAKIIIGPSGLVQGNMDGQQADVAGKVQGNIHVKELLQLRDACIVEGNIMAARLQIEPTATFNGQCKMTGSATSNNSGLQKKKNETAAKEAA